MEKQRFNLTGKVVVVTGGTGLIGSAYCQAIAEHGGQVVMADLAATDPVDKAKCINTSTSNKALGITCDVSSEDDVINLFQQVMTKFGRVDVVLNNAAATGEHLMRQGAVFTTFENSSLEVWESAIRVNLTGVYLVAREAGKAMLETGGA